MKTQGLRTTGDGMSGTRTPFLFIVGRGRSGTTLLRAMFDSHPDMAVPRESHFLVTMGQKRRRFERRNGFATEEFLTELLERTRFPKWGLPAEQVRNALMRAEPKDLPDALRAVYSAYAAFRGKRRYGDKTPIYVYHMDFLAKLFPEARFVHIIRDGRNAALSYLDMDFGPDTLEEAAIYWRRFVRRGRRIGKRLGDARYREVRYEDLVDDPERVLREICRYIDLDFDDQMLRYFERSSSALPQGANFRRPPTRGLRDWRQQMSDDQVALFELIAGKLLTELGYERANARLTARVRVRARGRWLRGQMRRFRRRTLKLGSQYIPVGVPPDDEVVEER